jgi:transcriptional regulator with XRE-family HTH domain
MESIGVLLKEARESKGYSIEQVARDTNIAKRYLEAMEREDTSVFPGETYFIGFLRNYSEFLGLDPAKLIGIFRNMQIQEQPVPMEELLVSKKKPLIPIILIIILILAGAGTGLFFLLGDRLFSGEAEAPVAAEENPSPSPPPSVTAGAGTVYAFQDEIMERSFLAGDTIRVVLNDQEYPLLLEELGPPVVFSLGGRKYPMEMEKGTVLDLSGDGEGDIKVFPRQLLEEEEAVVLYLDKYIESSDPVVRAIDEPEPTAAVEEEPASQVAGGLGTPSEPDRQGSEIVLIEADQPEPFDLDVVFRGLALFRWVADNEVREERYFHKGEVFKVEAKRELRLWISNAGSFKGRIGTVDIPLGNPGEVATRAIRWERDGNGKYQLKLIPMY